MEPNFAKATISLDEILADLRIKTEEEAQKFSKNYQPFFLAKISIKEPDESKPPQEIIGWISKDEYEVIDAKTELRYTSLRAEFEVLDYL
ncbi:MAG: hypothetical protein ACK5N8_09325 [Alphaproteobacteria bacterium]